MAKIFSPYQKSNLKASQKCLKIAFKKVYFIEIVLINDDCCIII